MVKEDPAQGQRRDRLREWSERKRALALTLLENDPEINTMREALRQAQEILELEAGEAKGGPQGAERVAAAQRAQERRAKSPARKLAGARRHRSSRPRSSTARRVRRAVTVPFGSTMSAAWTLLSGSLGLVLLYVGLRDAGAVVALTEALTRSLRRFADPYTPLIPDPRRAGFGPERSSP